MRKLLLVLRASPYRGSRAREGLDAALLFSAFSDNLRVLFSGEGAWQLQAGQSPGAIDMKSIAALVDAFELYGIDAAGVDAAAVAVRGIEAASLPAGIRLLDDAGVADWLAWADQVVTIG